MAKKNKFKNKNGNGKNGKNGNGGDDKETLPILTNRVKKTIAAIFLFVLAIIVAFSFWQKSGTGGDVMFKVFNFLVGKAVYVLPFLLLLTGFLILRPRKRRIFLPASFVFCLFIIGISGILATHNVEQKPGGWVGYLVAWPVFHYFGSVVSYIVSVCFIIIAGIIAFEMMPKGSKDKDKKEKPAQNASHIEAGKPKFEIKPVEVVKTANAVPEKLLKKPAPIEAKKEKLKTAEVVAPFIDNQYKFPPVELLEIGDEKPSSGDIEFNAAAIKKTLQNFGIEVEMADVNVGPTVTQYTLKPAEGVKLSKLTGLNNDLALSLAAHPIRIEAPIPGKSLVGIEVPNSTRAKVKLGSVVSVSEFQKSSALLNLALGKDVMGSPICVDLAGMPHMLVAGATGSGKSICLNTIIMSLIYRNSPKNLRIILIDPKRVEFPVYGELPHLLTPVILNARKAVNVLNWLVGEMERRFEVLQEAGARDIVSFNKIQQTKAQKAQKRVNQDNLEDTEPMPFIVLIVDELADLMMAKGKEVEAAVVRLSQLARAVGIHLVLATQRPSVEVITGLIKANITSRIAFQVASQIDSRTILDCAGAEKLLGKGDMLYISAEFSRPKRIQGNFVSMPEIKKVVDFIAKENSPQEMQNIDEQTTLMEDGEVPQARPMAPGVGANNHEDIVNFTAKDPLYDEAKEMVVKYQKASASLLQRRLQVGYARAARILDMLEEDGVIGQGDGAKPRTVLVSSNGTTPDVDGFQDTTDLEFG